MKNLIIVTACPDQVEGTDPEALGSPFTTNTLHSLMHIVTVLQTWLIEIEVGVMICLGQGDLHSLRASSSTESTLVVVTLFVILYKLG